MKDLKKIKLQLAKLDVNELENISTYIFKRKQVVRKQLYQKRIQDKIDLITVLPIGSKVVIDNNNWSDLTGKIGIITKHLGRGSKNSNVELCKTKVIWNIPRRYLSPDLSEENLEQIHKQKIDTQRLHGFISKIKF